jgi:TonB family protein
MNALHSSPMLSWLLSYLFNALWQIPLVFAAAWIAARMLRRTTPLAEHRIWVGALLLEVVLPACDLRFATLLSGIVSWVPFWISPWFWQQGRSGNGGVRVLLGPGEINGNLLHLPSMLFTGIAVAYGCTVLYFAGRLAWGLFATHALARSAARIELTGEAALRWTKHCRRLGITALRPEIAVSPRAIGPVTIGLHRGLLLLPPAFLEVITPADLDAVLAHELVHVARYDFAKNLFYSLVSLPVVCHPLLWRTRARVAESRELTCDAIAVDLIAADAVAGRRQYAQSLLRLASMLSTRPPGAALYAIGIFSFSPRSGNPDSRTFERRIMTLTRKPAQMSGAGRIVVATACCALALATCGSALALRTDVSATTATNAKRAKIHVESRIMSSQKISGDNPVYPQEARAKKIQGAVVLTAVIGKDGTIENLLVVKSPDPSLAESAIKAVRTWRYRPYLLNGDPVEVETTVNVVYTLEG